MAKYSFELKKEIVNEYLTGKGGYKTLAKNNGIPVESVRKWVNVYQTLGEEGLLRSRKNTTYSFEFKLHVVELYLTTEVSYRELALSQKMNNSSMVVKWVKEFREGGPDALRPKKKGRKKTLKTEKQSDSAKNDIKVTLIDTSAEYIKELEDENLKLRIENAYLKELRRLRLEEEALQKKRRESSTASEENSN